MSFGMFVSDVYLTMTMTTGSYLWQVTTATSAS